MRRLMVALLGASALSLGALAADEKAEPVATSAADMTITCGTPIAWDATEESLKAKFGADNVVHKDLGGPEGTEMFGTQIYSKDAKKTFEVVWTDDQTWSKPAFVQVTQVWSEDGETATSPDWASAQGVKVGMTIEEVEKINGKPFKLSGFGWDYGGNAVNWEGGKLELAADAKCGISIVFTDSGDSTPDSVLGDKEITSDAADVRAAKPVVARYIVYYVYPDPEAPVETPSP